MEKKTTRKFNVGAKACVERGKKSDEKWNKGKWTLSGQDSTKLVLQLMEEKGVRNFLLLRGINNSKFIITEDPGSIPNRQQNLLVLVMWLWNLPPRLRRAAEARCVVGSPCTVAQSCHRVQLSKRSLDCSGDPRICYSCGVSARESCTQGVETVREKSVLPSAKL